MKYDAFISYRHAELDQFVAENLHKKLEAFRLPKTIVKQRGADCKKKIERVFRDRDELPLATNLADPITDALENSEFLIVICSPRLPQSLWCKKEIETFISLHGRERVLAVLIEGEPEKSFPEELLYRTRKITHKDGTVEVIKEPVEPLAADVRGTTKKEVLKKMDEELLRLTAAMFQCGYDDLKQRHKEQKMKKMLTASLAASAIFLAFGAVSTTMAIRIQSQKEQIQAQSKEITAQKERIEEQYQEALYNQSLTMAEKSLDLLEEGDRLEALRVACEALGETEDGTPMPITAEAQYALAESSYLYQDGENYEPMYQFKHDANISMIQVSPNGERLLILDKYGTVCVWNILEHKLLAQFSGTNSSYESEKDCFFLNDNQILYDGKESFEIFDIDKQEIVYTYSGGESFLKGKADLQNRWFAVTVDDFLDETLLIYDAQNFELLFSYMVPAGKTVSGAMEFSRDDSLFAFALEPDITSESTGSVIMTMDLETGEISEGFSAEYSAVEKIGILDGVLYAGVNQSIDDAYLEGNSGLNMPYKSTLYAIDLESMVQVWEYNYDYGMISYFQINAADYSRHILLSFYSEAHIIDMDTGAGVHEFAYGDEIVTSFYYASSDYFALITDDGEYHILDGTSGSDMLREGYFRSNSDNYKQILLSKNGLVSLPLSDTDVTYYEFVEGAEYEVLCELNNAVSDVIVNASEDRAAALSTYDSEEGTTISLIDLETGEILKEIYEEEVSVYVETVCDVDETFLVVTQEKVSLYSFEDGSLQAEYEFPETIYIDYLSISTDGQSIILRENSKFWKINLADGSQECVELNDEGDSILAACVSNDFSSYAIADSQENAILLYRMGEEDAYMRIDIVASFIQDIFYTNDNGSLFVYYVDETAEMFDLESGLCIQEYDSLGGMLFGFDTVGEGYLISTLKGEFLLNSNYEVIANIPECADIMPTSQRFIGIDGKTIYICPVYTIEELCKKAEEILAGL